MRVAARRVHAELLRLGLATEGREPGEVERVCEEIVDLARKHCVPPEVAARTFAYQRAVIAASPPQP